MAETLWAVLESQHLHFSILRLHDFHWATLDAEPGAVSTQNVYDPMEPCHGRLLLYWILSGPAGSHFSIPRPRRLLQIPLHFVNYPKSIYAQAILTRLVLFSCRDGPIISEEHTSTAAFWGLMNIMSRVMELVGTSLIVLKKKPLIFLHW